MDDLGAFSTPAVQRFRYKQLKGLQPDHACKHKETCLQPINPRRLVTVDDAYEHSINFTLSPVPSP